VVFDFRMGRALEGPKAFLDKFDKLLQTDGYVAYDGVGGKNLVRAACWSHARSKFVDAVKLNPKNVAAAGPVMRIDALFAVDARGSRREARSCSTSPTAPVGVRAPARSAARSAEGHAQ